MTIFLTYILTPFVVAKFAAVAVAVAHIKADKRRGRF